MAVVYSEDTISEEREEFMVSPTGGIPFKRIAHFLKPTVSSMQDTNLKLPWLSPKSKWPLDVAFNGWRDPEKKWCKWVEQMHCKHYSVWRKAGILEAIMASKYIIHRNDELVFGIVERWCSDTNTFVLPWGETTITLEDMMILGRFSVLGGPVFLPLEKKELIDIDQILRKVHKNFERMKRHNHFQWLDFFMKCGADYEHEAFLCLWLSRYVFPGNEFDKIGEHVFAIAIHLARGTRIALAPAVLASIYRDLSLLKATMAASTQLEGEEGEGNILALSLWAPLQLVQLWAWERLLPFRPEPNFVNFGELRVARWHDLKKFDIGNVRPILDSCGDIFLWRPYCLAVDNWSCPKFYKEKEELALIGKYPDEDLTSYARCLRVCVLLGIECEEPYNPHRVAMQFGFDQDLPRWIPRSNASLEVSWINYSKPLNNGATLYLPSRTESDVSIQYLEWWRKAVLVPVDSIQGLVRRKRSSRTRKKHLPDPKQIEVERIGSDVLPGFPPTCNRLEEYNQTPNAWLQSSNKQQIETQSNHPDFPPGFLPKCQSAGPQTSAGQQIKVEVNDLDIPPGFPPKCQNAGPETSNRHQIKVKVEAKDLDVPQGFPPKCQSSKLETSKNQIKVEVTDLVVPPGFPPKFYSMNENNPTRIQMPQKSKALRTSEDSHQLKPSSTCQFEGASSSTAAMGASKSIETTMNPAGTAGVGSRIFAGHGYETGGGNSTSNRSEGEKNKDFEFCSKRLEDLQARMNKIKSEVSKLEQARFKYR